MDHAGTCRLLRVSWLRSGSDMDASQTGESVMNCFAPSSKLGERQELWRTANTSRTVKLPGLSDQLFINQQPGLLVTRGSNIASIFHLSRSNFSHTTKTEPRCIHEFTMDPFDSTEKYSQLFASAKQNLNKAKERQGQSVCDWKPKAEAYVNFLLSLMSKGLEDTVQEVFLPPAYLPCIKPTADLELIAIKDLQLETHHRGKYILLRSLTAPRRKIAVTALMEDESGDSILLQLYQQAEENARKAVYTVNVGTILLVKDPYLMTRGDGEYVLRVDHVSDVIQVDEDDARIPKLWRSQRIEIGHSAETLRIKGNLAMSENRHWNAITE